MACSTIQRMETDVQELSLLDRVAVVTQATRANGPAICTALGRQGATVALGDREAAALAAETLKLSQAGIKALGIETDVSQPGQIESLLTQTVKAYGHVDLLVNNTVFSEPQPAAELPVATFALDVALNQKSVFFGCQSAARHMLAQTPLQTEPYPIKGTIINIASVAGVVAIPGYAGLCAAMAGVIAMTRALAAEWGPQGLRVVALGAGLPQSLIEKYQPASLSTSYIERYIPLGVPTSPAAIGEAVVCLASDAAGHVTGTTLYADGGWLAYGYL